MVEAILSAIPSFKRLLSSRSDDWIDRLNHIYTVFLLVIFGVLVSTGQYIGDPIHCWCPAEFTGSFEAYTKMYCWIKNTYYIPMGEAIPIDVSKRQGSQSSRCCAIIWKAHIEQKVAGLLGAVPSFKKLSSSRSDDWIDRMSHIYTVFLLVIFAMLVSTGQFVGDPIHCWCPAQFTGAFEAYTKNYCWIKNTYYIPMMETIPIDIHKRQEAEITYYQWVPLILLFQAFMFKFPNVLWKMLNGGSGLNLDKICKLADETQWGSPDDRKSAIENMSFFLDRWLLTHRQYKHNFIQRAKAKASRLFCFLCNKREGTFLTALYLCIKVLYIGNVIGQFFLLNAFMATDYNLYGFEYIKMLQSGESMKESPRFPRVTLCDFRIRQLQNIQRWTVQCVLPINLFNEKIFIFLWFWFFFIAFLSGFNLVKWMFLIVLKRNNYQYVKKYLVITDHMQTASDKKLCRRFAEHYLRDDGCFVARMIGMNSTDMVITDLLDCMWRNYRLREEPKPSEYPEDDEAKLLDKEKDTSPLNFRGNNVPS